jgi:DNA invertase Pin-like site-specific DNA recombinase
MLPTSNLKIHLDHLERQAFIYVRQSTLAQVLHNTASTARQYDLEQRALDLGWPSARITVIDQDQAQSGTSAIGRDGFQFMVAQVGLGRVGAVFCLEASRLARAGSDWHRLIEICALSDTLVIDADGIYDPGQFNDRLVLGIKGTMSEAELHWLRQRLLGGKLEKASQGQLRVRLPTGLVYDPVGHVVFDPDEAVQQAVRLVFAVFDDSKSALAVVKHFDEQQLLFPTRHWGGVRDGELAWQPLRHSRVLAILHNPAYAGAYVYGRTQTRTRLLPGEEPRIKGRTRQVKLVDWPILLPEAHPGYITWEQFVHIQQQLDDNRTFCPEERRGAVREGSAWLQGIVLCGHCGRGMSVRYPANSQDCYYTCNQLHSQLARKTCQSIRGHEVNAAVAHTFLAAMQPAQLEVSLSTLDQLEARARQIDHQWQLRLERAQYEVDLARRRFIAVEPENRLVARYLEREWNERLVDLARLQKEYETRPQPKVQLASATERQRILALVQDLPTVWQAPSTTHADRKQLLRFLIKDVTLTRGENTIHIGVRWQTEALTELEVPRPLRVHERSQTDPAVVERVRQLASTHTDRQIAEQLNQAGFTPGMAGSFSKGKVQWIRHAYKIISGCPEAPGLCPTGQRGDGRYSAKAAATLLNVDVSTIADWCEVGRLDCVRARPHGPRWITLTPEIIARLGKPVKKRWLRRHQDE